jgi:hypothetical protein
VATNGRWSDAVSAHIILDEQEAILEQQQRKLARGARCADIVSAVLHGKGHAA